jgi:membrane dipeptidase
VRHVEHICQLVGSRRHVGLGTDADGGFSAARLPEGINLPSDYSKLIDELARLGWADADIRGFTSGNFLRLFPMLGGT